MSEMAKALREDLAAMQLSATELVRAVQAQPPDSAQRARAVNDLRSAVDDYEFAVGQAGDLGGAEL